MAAPLAAINGRLLPLTDATLAVVDAGFVSGATIVDNARTYRGQLFRWPQHLARFRRDCDDCFVPLLASDAEITAIAEQLLTHNRPLTPDRELQLVTFATPGPLGFYTGTTNGPPTLGLVTYPVPVARYRRFFTDGITLAIVGSHSVEASDLLPPRVKHRSRLHWHIADQLAKQRDPHAIAAVVNHDVADTAIGSIVGVRADGMIVCPPPEYVQDSISLHVLRELTPTQTAVIAYDEPTLTALLLVGTGFGIASVRRVLLSNGEREFAWPSRACQQLTERWSQLVGVDITAEFPSSL